MSYVDGFVFAVPKKKVAEYKKIATKAGKVWMEHGALADQECLGDDIPKKKKGSVSFPGMVLAKPAELIGFSWIVYKSRAHRDKPITQALSGMGSMESPLSWNIRYLRSFSRMGNWKVGSFLMNSGSA